MDERMRRMEVALAAVCEVILDRALNQDTYHQDQYRPLKSFVREVKAEATDEYVWAQGQRIRKDDVLLGLMGATQSEKVADGK